MKPKILGTFIDYDINEKVYNFNNIIKTDKIKVFECKIKKDTDYNLNIALNIITNKVDNDFKLIQSNVSQDIIKQIKSQILKEDI